MVRVLIGLLGVSILLACVPTESESGTGDRPEAPSALSAPKPRAEPPRANDRLKLAQEAVQRRTTPNAAAAADAGAADAGASKTAAPKPPGAKGDAAPAPLITSAFEDDFQREELGDDYVATSDAWTLRVGRLCVRNAKNQPVWLRRRLPVNARIEFDASSSSPDGDIKAELWADGRSAASGVSYNDATGYLVILGGWRNQFHVLARLDEHAPDRPEVRVDPSGNDLRARPVAPHHTYHFKIERRDGRTLRWFVDDIEVISFTDPQPLKGSGHEYFGFNDWQTPVCFDNLKITPLAN